MHKNSFLDSKQINELQDDIFRNQIIKLHDVVERQHGLKDLLLCRRWVTFLAQANDSENYLRNYMMALIYDQLTSNGRLNKPFTDETNIEKKRSLGNIMASLSNNFENDERERRQTEIDKELFAFGKCCELKEFAKQSDSSGSPSDQSSDKTVKTSDQLSVNCCERINEASLCYHCEWSRDPSSEQSDQFLSNQSGPTEIPSCGLTSHLEGPDMHDQRPMTSSTCDCGLMTVIDADSGHGIVFVRSSLRQYNPEKIFNAVRLMKTRYDLLNKEFDVLEQQISKIYKVPVIITNYQKQSSSPNHDDGGACGGANQTT